MLKAIGGVLAGLIVGGGAAAGAYAARNITASQRGSRAVRRAGFESKRVTLGTGTTLAYSEGPVTGPTVVLIHAQSSARQNYNPVLSELARDHHVVAVDIAGHGESDRTPGRYTVHEIGADLVEFITTVADAPVILSGHSSGGLLAAWIAAEAPDLVSAVLLEDPPFFSTDPGRYEESFNYHDLAAPAHAFLQQTAVTDFPSWYIEHNAWITYLGESAEKFIRYAQKSRRRAPQKPLRFWFLPPKINETFAYMHQFDPAFADAFYTQAWQRDFDQECTLERVTQPATLVHANWRTTEDGVLEGAMTDADAQRAAEALPAGHMVRVSTGHGFHIEDPTLFVDLLRETVRTVPLGRQPGR